ncbi:TetR/AcrR family transcriptional regulator [Gordonia mangrovi]|nr:TetR/AcrR family transcriptional regulator [Gordonia mangrovi]UVF77090.1 TetR/AcrR family transcriptional regulator [Gordonia mangrovi]
MSDLPNRPYNGVDSEKRVAMRKERLLHAGLEILGNPQGPESLTLRTICGRAHLAQRYFYESFADKDEFAAAVYDWSIATLLEAAKAAFAQKGPDPARAGVVGVVEAIADDQRIGQLLFSPHQLNATLVRKRFESTATFVEVFSKYLRSEYQLDEHGQAPLLAHFLVGGAGQAIAAWLNGDVAVSRDQVIEDLVEMLAAHGVGGDGSQRLGTQRYVSE